MTDWTRRRGAAGARNPRPRRGGRPKLRTDFLIRFTTRPAIANERLKRNRAGQVVLQFKSAYHDGTNYTG